MGKEKKQGLNIGIFCSANSNIDKVYFDKTAELGEWIGRNGHTVVFGGCDLGLMEHVAKHAVSSGGKAIGIVPTIIEERGKVSPHCTTVIPCSNLSDRKDLLLEHSDVIIALPGGVGTLDEIFTVVAAHTIGYHDKEVILYNINGFWNSLIAMLDDLQARNMIRGEWKKYILTASNLPELVSLLLPNVS